MRIGLLVAAQLDPSVKGLPFLNPEVEEDVALFNQARKKFKEEVMATNSKRVQVVEESNEQVVVKSTKG